MSGDHPQYIPIPVQSLRSAMKHPSRPGTPLSPPSISPAIRPSSSPSPFTPTPSSSSHSTLSYQSPSPFKSQSPSFGAPIVSHSPSASTIVQMNPHPSPAIAAAGYTPKVSFDTFENPAASMFSFTLQVKSDGYARTRSTRVFLCASSPDESGSQALDWALESLAQDGDELIVFRGVDAEDLEKDHDVVREEARELMRAIQEKGHGDDPDRKLSIIVEFIAGKITETLDRLIALYRPDSVVVGTRGPRGMMQAWGAAFGAPGMGSISKYCLSHSPVPIIVVRPERKVRKVLAKRRADPKRGTHFDEITRTRTSNIQSVPMTPASTKSNLA